MRTAEQFIDSFLRWGRGSAAVQMKGFTVGNSKELLVVPVIPPLRSGVARTVTKAWLGIKSPETATDATANAAFTSAGGLLSITTTETAGRGQILQSSEGSAELRFDITAANAAALTPHKTYSFAVQVLMSDGLIYEVDSGAFDTARQIITATS